MGIPLMRGRKFTREDSTQAAIINEVMAKKFWPGEDPIGKRINFGNIATTPWVTIVGLVGNVRHLGLDIEPRPEVYRPYGNNPLTGPMIVVHTAIDPGTVIPSIRAAIRGIESAMPIEVNPVERLVELSTAPRRFSMLLLGIFAGVAMALAVVGIYGVISYSVTQRTHEIGLRMALGAQSAQVLKMIVGEGLALTATGIAIGVAGALAVTRVMTALLFEISATDAMTYATVSAVLLFVALVACYIPARRATQIEPNVALRYE